MRGRGFGKWAGRKSGGRGLKGVGGAPMRGGATGCGRGLLEDGGPNGAVGIRRGGVASGRGGLWEVGGAKERWAGLREGLPVAPHCPPVAPIAHQLLPVAPMAPNGQQSGGRGYVDGGAWPGGPEMGVSPLSHAPLPQSRSSPTTVAPPPSPPWRRGHAPRPTPRPDWLWATKRGGSTSCAGTRPPPEATPTSEATPPRAGSHSYCVKPRPSEATPASEATPLRSHAYSLKPRPLLKPRAL